MMPTGWYGSSRYLTSSSVRVISSASGGIVSENARNMTRRRVVLTEDALDVRQLRRANDRRAHPWLREYPCHGDLGHCLPSLLSDLVDPARRSPSKQAYQDDVPLRVILPTFV